MVLSLSAFVCVWMWFSRMWFLKREYLRMLHGHACKALCVCGQFLHCSRSSATAADVGPALSPPGVQRRSGRRKGWGASPSPLQQRAARNSENSIWWLSSCCQLVINLQAVARWQKVGEGASGQQVPWYIRLTVSPLPSPLAGASWSNTLGWALQQRSSFSLGSPCSPQLHPC